LPNITYISVVKLLNNVNETEYYFRLFADYFGNITHPYLIKEEEEELEAIQNIEEKTVKSKARVGQGKYREELLNQCPFCPITLISDDRLLIASHIKPWAKSNDKERIDPFNGFMFTPTFDYLFDKGFISFTNDKKIILSPFLSKMTYSKLGIYDNKNFPSLPINGRENYLDYHRNEILKR
jgi:predicted restriction endonuclease